MKGDIRIVRHKADALTELPASVAGKSKKFRTVYVLLRDLCTSGRLNQLFEDFLQMVGVTVAIIDLDANVLASSNWQRICRDFHRENPDTCSRCIESDTKLANQLEAGKAFTMYRCRNGLTDCASPIIIEDQHVANLFIGQFLLQPPDIDFFLGQAEVFGFEPSEYIAALNEVPVVDEKVVPNIMNFLTGFARLIASMGMDKLHVQEADEIHHQRLEQEVTERTRQLTRRTKELEMAHQELALLAAMDGLTKIANRRYLDEQMEKEWRRLTRDRKPLSLIMIDIDHFKKYNDLYGHLAGDECLVTIAWILRESIRRPADLAARFGGEEFVCALSDTDLEGALRVSQLIGRQVREAEIPHSASSVAPYVTLSMGVATCVPDASRSVRDLLEAADRCLYQAKAEGRNRVISASI